MRCLLITAAIVCVVAAERDSYMAPPPIFRPTSDRRSEQPRLTDRQGENERQFPESGFNFQAAQHGFADYEKSFPVNFNNEKVSAFDRNPTAPHQISNNNGNQNHQKIKQADIQRAQFSVEPIKQLERFDIVRPQFTTSANQFTPQNNKFPTGSNSKHPHSNNEFGNRRKFNDEQPFNNHFHNTEHTFDERTNSQRAVKYGNEHNQVQQQNIKQTFNPLLRERVEDTRMMQFSDNFNDSENRYLPHRQDDQHLFEKVSSPSQNSPQGSSRNNAFNQQSPSHRVKQGVRSELLSTNLQNTVRDQSALFNNFRNRDHNKFINSKTTGILQQHQGTGTHFDEGTGTHFEEGTGAHFDEGTGTHFDEGTGTHFEEGTGTHFDEGTGTYFEEGTGTHFDEGTGTHFEEGTGTHFGEGTGTHFNARCNHGEVPSENGGCVQLKITRNVYVYEKPKSDVQQLSSNRAEKLNYNILFIKNTNEASELEEISQKKTIVYVLNKEPTVEEQKKMNDNHEVYFVKYQEGANPILPHGQLLQTESRQFAESSTQRAVQAPLNSGRFSETAKHTSGSESAKHTSGSETAKHTSGSESAKHNPGTHGDRRSSQNSFDYSFESQYSNSSDNESPESLFIRPNNSIIKNTVNNKQQESIIGNSFENSFENHESRPNERRPNERRPNERRPNERRPNERRPNERRPNDSQEFGHQTNFSVEIQPSQQNESSSIYKLNSNDKSEISN